MTRRSGLHFNSIRARMTGAFTLAIAVLMLLVCGGLLWYARRSAEREVSERLHATARNFLIEVGNGGRKAALAEIAEENGELKAQGIHASLSDAHWVVIAEAGDYRAGIQEETFRIVNVRVGADTVDFKTSWVAEERALFWQGAALFVLSLIVVLATGVGAWALVGRTLSPIGALARQADAATADPLSLRLQAPSHDAEVVGLVETLNGLLSRLSDAAAARGQFYAAASHELRTPLQALLGHLEVALGRERTGEEYRAAITEARNQTDRLTALVRDLLALNRLQSGHAPAAEPVDMADVCDRAIRAYGSLAESRHLCVTINLPDALPLPAPPTHAEMLVRNLVENAVKYAAPGGGVWVELAAQPPGLTVRNDCAAPPAFDAATVFEPFHRPDASRNSQTGGNGLGLAICKAVADANGWRIRLEAQGNYAVATVLFRPNTGG